MERFATALEDFLRASSDAPSAVPAPLEPIPSQPETASAVIERRRGNRRVAWFLLVLGAALIGGIIYGIFWRSQKPTDALQEHRLPADALQEHSRWSGTFTWGEGDKDPKDIQVIITKRTGDSFEGIYTTENNQHEWDIKGEVRGGTVSWKFTQCKRNIKADEHLVKDGSVEGTYTGEQMEVTFYDKGDGSKTVMTLRLEKQASGK
jgi:hypothetical protein